MKTNIWTLFFFIAMSFTACGSSSDPLGIAEKFAKAYFNVDYDTCNKLMDGDEFTPSNEMSSMEKSMIKAMKKEAKQMQYVFALDKENTYVREDFAYVYFIITSAVEPGFEEMIEVKLEKEDTAGWYVADYFDLD
ncbi:MAG: hypothetical protein LBH80_07385 [Prevotellaceae bacterium]|jgi:hypothetical protein|nr:hypothetical protein [Prevotellaceae bacterium]